MVDWNFTKKCCYWLINQPRQKHTIWEVNKFPDNPDKSSVQNNIVRKQNKENPFLRTACNFYALAKLRKQSSRPHFGWAWQKNNVLRKTINERTLGSLPGLGDYYLRLWGELKISCVRLIHQNSILCLLS